MARVIMYTYDTAYIGERFYFTRYFEYQQNLGFSEDRYRARAYHIFAF
jgi:hypothetical protein